MTAHKILMALVAVAAPHLVAAQTACALNLSFSFTESAPRDLFELRNESSAGQSVQRLSLVLAGSAGRLIFDTDPGGPGVEVFQPFRVESGEALLKGMPSLQDGSDRLDLVFDRFDAGQRFQFSIDVDDRLGASDLGQIRVSGREMEGATLTAVIGPAGGPGREVQARIDASHRARLQAGCS